MNLFKIDQKKKNFVIKIKFFAFIKFEMISFRILQKAFFKFILFYLFR